MTEPGTELSPTRAKVLGVLRSRERAQTVAEVAEELAVHPNTVRFHLAGLIERGQVERVETAPQGAGRPAVRVRAVAAMDPAGPRHYRVLAEVLTFGLADAPEPAERARRVGRAWGGRLVASEPGAMSGREPAGAGVADPVSGLLAMLDDLGFAPDRSGSDISLRHCPFLELAASASEAVCSVPLGLMQGAL